jgi:NADH dehydrogenase
MKILEHADEIRRLLLMALEEAEQTRDPSQRAFLQTVVVGAGPAGCELAGSLIELMQRAVQRDFKQLHLEDCRVVLGDPVDRVLPTMAPVLSEAAAAYLRAAGVDRRLGLKVEGIAPGRLSLSGAVGEIQLEAATICWTAGVRASRLGLLLASHTGCPEPRSPAPPRAGLLSSGPSRDPGGG